MFLYSSAKDNGICCSSTSCAVAHCIVANNNIKKAVSFFILLQCCIYMYQNTNPVLFYFLGITPTNSTAH